MNMILTVRQHTGYCPIQHSTTYYRRQCIITVFVSEANRIAKICILAPNLNQLWFKKNMKPYFPKLACELTCPLNKILKQGHQFDELKML